jgi:hypothetical protein
VLVVEEDQEIIHLMFLVVVMMISLLLIAMVMIVMTTMEMKDGVAYMTHGNLIHMTNAVLVEEEDQEIPMIHLIMGIVLMISPQVIAMVMIAQITQFIQAGADNMTQTHSILMLNAALSKENHLQIQMTPTPAKMTYQQ